MSDDLDRRAARARAELTGMVERAEPEMPTADAVRRRAARRRAGHAALALVLVVVSGSLVVLARPGTDPRSTVVADRPATGSGTPAPVDVVTEGTTGTTAGQTAVTTVPTTAAPKAATPAEACSSPAPAPDRPGLWGVPSDGAAVRLYETHAGDGLYSLARSPDGGRFAFFLGTPGRGSGDVDLVVADRRGSARVVEGRPAGQIAWAPDGQRVVFSSQKMDLPSENPPPARLEAADLRDGTVRVVWEESSPSRIGAVTVRPDGAVLFVVAPPDPTTRYDTAILAEARLDGSGYRQVTDGLYHRSQLVLSPDGASVAVIAHGSRVVVDLATGNQRALSPSPQGTELKGFSGPGALTDNVLAWSPDGDWLSFLYGGGYNGGYVTLQPLDGGSPIQWSRAGNATGASYDGVVFSSDSRHAVMVQAEPGLPGGVHVIDLADGTRRRLLPDGYRVAPGPDGTVLALVVDPEDENADPRLCRLAFDGSNARPILRQAGESELTLPLNSDSLPGDQSIVVPL